MKTVEDFPSDIVASARRIVGTSQNTSAEIILVCEGMLLERERVARVCEARSDAAAKAASDADYPLKAAFAMAEVELCVELATAIRSGK